MKADKPKIESLVKVGYAHIPATEEAEGQDAVSLTVDNYCVCLSAELAKFVAEQLIGAATFIGPTSSKVLDNLAEALNLEEDSLEACASDLRHSALVDTEDNMRGCVQAVAVRILKLEKKSSSSNLGDLVNFLGELLDKELAKVKTSAGDRDVTEKFLDEASKDTTQPRPASEHYHALAAELQRLEKEGRQGDPDSATLPKTF